MASAASSAATSASPPPEQPTGPHKVPLPSPLPTCKPQANPPLTAEEQQKYDWLLAQAKGWTTIPSVVEGKSGPLTDDEKLWLTRECMLRYLRATKWHEKESEKRLLETLTWRREYGVEDLTPDMLSVENETGKQLIAGYDNEGRPCNYMSPARQNTDPSPRHVQHLVFMVERMLDLMPPRQETLTLLVNFKAGKDKGSGPPGLDIGKKCLNVLQMHYPERLGRSLIINVPWIVWGFFKLITPFIDPRTAQKIHFNEDMTQYVPKEQLWTEYPGGEMDFEYDHKDYWPALWNLCQERRATRKERWIAGGKHLGDHEDFLAGHSDQGCGAAGGDAEGK